MSKKGIQLSFDESGNASIKDDGDKEECFGGVFCKECEVEDDGSRIIMICNAVADGEENNVFKFKSCPQGRWNSIDYTQDVMVDLPQRFHYDRETCSHCGTTTVWQLKDTKDKSHWICFGCSPPAYFIKSNQVIKKERKT